MNKLFDGQVALVRVVVASHRSKESAETVKLIETAGSEAMFVKTDVPKAVQVEALIAQTVGCAGVPEEVANAMLWLCSDRASFATGHTPSVDGGLLVP